MTQEIYVFGSLVRGDVSRTSDADILVVPLAGQARQCYPSSWSVYSVGVLEDFYTKGRLFAWHLHFEAKCVYCPSSVPVLNRFGSPAPYNSALQDIEDLEMIMQEALSEIRRGTNSLIFELGIVHTAIRDIAMSASWKLLGKPNFSRDSPYALPVQFPLSSDLYHSIVVARHQSTRGVEEEIDAESISAAILSAPISAWTKKIKELM